MSLIDIIIPIKGRPELLQDRSLPSLLVQTLQTFKVTIVDDGSTKEESQQIEEIAREYRQRGLNIQVIQNGGSPGAAGARNFGFESTSADYVLWFDSDDILLKNKLELSMSLITSGHYDLAITRAQHIAGSNLINEFWGEPTAPNRGTYEFHFPYQTMCALYRRQFLLQKKIRWNESNNLNDDWEISNEVLLTTNKWVYSPDVTAHYFVPTSESGSIGSRLTKSKIESQKQALSRIKALLTDAQLTYTLVGFYKRLKLRILLAFKGIL